MAYSGLLRPDWVIGKVPKWWFKQADGDSLLLFGVDVTEMERAMRNVWSSPGPTSDEAAANKAFEEAGNDLFCQEIGCGDDSESTYITC